MNIQDIQAKKDNREKIVVLTCYDYAMAKLLDRVGIDMILVGDSLGMVVLGYDSTRHVTMEDMIRHTAAVRRGSQNSLIVGDMPYGSYDSAPQALKNAGRLLEAGADIIKVERGREIADIVEALVAAGIPVMGHLGLTPQTAESFRVQGRDPVQAEDIKKDALLLQELGAMSIVLESIPCDLALEISQVLTIPTIGIGAGPDTDGQVLVLYDMLGLFSDFCPKFVKHFAHLNLDILQAVQQYKQEVEEGVFPSAAHSFFQGRKGK